VAALTGDQDYINAIQAIWENVTRKKLSLTGGIGARHKGEAFGEDYELPNASAYNETCAAIGSIFWNLRLFLLNGSADYFDVLERTLYNGFLSGISLAGNTFFYVNPLESDGDYHFNRDNTIERQPWFGCSCCPTNVVRLLPSLSGYLYATRADRLFVNLFMGNQAKLTVNGADVEITQMTNYPWDGAIRLTVNPGQSAEFTLSLRIPGWAQGRPVPGDLYRYVDDTPGAVELKVNGESQPATIENGYINLTRTWQPGDVIELNLPMPIRRVVAHPNAADLVGKVALERGPLVYAAEGVDNNGHILNKVIADDMPLNAEHRPDLLGRVTVIKGEDFMAIPYYAWSHRGVGEMAVWFNRA
jgi:DUF1680 family protein